MALSVLSRNILLCYLALILAVSATKWQDGLWVFVVFSFLKRGQRRGLPSFPFSSRAGPDCHKGSGHTILNARGR